MGSTHICILHSFAYLLVLLPHSLLASESVLSQYCWPNVFNASCPEGEVILMEHAHYGRMRLSKCLTSDIHVGCYADVLQEVDARCSGRNECKIEIPDTRLHGLQPCPKDMLAYLEAAYTCIKVEMAGSTSCDQFQSSVLTADMGYISSTSLASSDDNPPQCAWTIQVTPGKRINITLFDFSLAMQKLDDPGFCPIYVTVKEPPDTDGIKICRGIQRQRHVHLSEHNSVELIVNAVSPKDGRFLIKYEAIGCADPVIPKEAKMKRTDDRIAISCNHSSETWYLVCSQNQWLGVQRNCTASLPRTSKGGDEYGSIFPYSTEEPFNIVGLLTAVIIGIVMGVVIGIVLLGTVLVCERRRRRRGRPLQKSVCVQDSNSECGDISRICSEELKPHRLGNYGYTHVWELRSLKSTQDEPSPKTTTYRPKEAIYCEHTFKCANHAHMYESPHRASCLLQQQTSEDESPPGKQLGGVFVPKGGVAIPFYPHDSHDLIENSSRDGQTVMDVDLVAAPIRPLQVSS